MPPTPIPLVRRASPADRDDIADLICLSTNHWYRASGKPPVFTGGPDPCQVFWDVYDTIDPGCCVVAQEPRTGRLMGSCFYRSRPTHYALGIMNAHPNYFGHGVARLLLQHVTDLADTERKPIRLVSSAMNLDSFSLYTRAGFSPRAVYHDMILPPEKVPALAGVDRRSIRPAAIADLPAILDLEMKVSGIQREQDWRHMIENAAGIWTVWVSAAIDGRIEGALGSIQHAASNMLGPGVMTTDAIAASLIAAELLRRGSTAPPLFLAPADRPELIQTLYGWGAKNVELHLHQVRGHAEPFRGVAMQTFMPETG